MTETASRATLPVLRALLDYARRKDYRSGVLGIRARPEWTSSPTFMHADVPVRVVPCVSALAVREALLERERDQWLVILTDRPDDDLGAGILSRLLWHRLRTPDPWDAVRERFAANGIDPALTATADDREVAVGLLAAAPLEGGWPPAPGGVLTRDHALGAVAATHLGLTDPVIDATSVLGWMAGPTVMSHVAALRALAGDALTGAVLSWAAGQTGAIGRPLLHLLRGGEARDAVSLGLVAGLLGAAREATVADAKSAGPLTAAGMQLAREGLIRLEPRLGGTAPAAAVLQSWAGEAAVVISGLVQDPASRAHGTALLARADELLAESHAAGLADRSDLLPTGLTRRFASLAQSLRNAVPTTAGGKPDRPDEPRVQDTALAGVEWAWMRVATHRLAEDDPRLPAFRAAVRLSRWLAADSAVIGRSLGALADRQLSVDAWVDSAVNDASPGVSDPDLGAGLAAVLAVVRERRATHDTIFATALAAHTSDDPASVSGRHADVWHLEDLLPEVVLPLALRTPVLLLVLDGMSTGVATEVMASVLSRTSEGWAEALLPSQSRRAAALAVLPTLTEVSRASLLCGQLCTGGQEVEKRGYVSLLHARGVRGTTPFHKKLLDSSRLGYSVADDVADAITDVTGNQLVTCVLNTIDDALDRSDPGGTAWGAGAVRHLVPLLDRARQAGRVVILTADHGHIVERRLGRMRASAAISSGRSRSAAEPAGDGEVLVAGRRVLLHDGRAILAVDEQLRYGPLKAGYHGGGAPAEAVVPVAILVSGTVPDDVDLKLAPPQEPTWWLDPAAPLSALAVPSRPPGMAGPVHALAARAREAAPTLFDEPVEAPSVPDAAAQAPASQAGSAAVAVLRSAAWAEQKKIAGRVSVSDDQIRALLDAFLATPDRRLVPGRAATVLQVAPIALRGAILHAQRLLNIEGYPVLRVDADGVTVILDEPLLREQFGVGQ